MPTSEAFKIGRGRIRTFEGISHQIYSLTRLSTSVRARVLVPWFGAGSIFQRPGIFNLAPSLPGVVKIDLQIGRLGVGRGYLDLVGYIGQKLFAERADRRKWNPVAVEVGDAVVQVERLIDRRTNRDCGDQQP